jgi:hypothetical protein
MAAGAGDSWDGHLVSEPSNWRLVDGRWTCLPTDEMAREYFAWYDMVKEHSKFPQCIWWSIIRCWNPNV